MILTTSQSLDFDITKDKVDLSKSPNLEKINALDDIFEYAYNWLFNKLGYDKWIWCYKVGDRNFLNHGEEHVLWTLDVPESECIYLNETVWEHIINKCPYNKAMDDPNFVISDEDYDKFRDSFKGKEEETWGDIFNPNDKSGVQVLVKSPILEKYVVKKEWISDYDLKQFTETDIINYHINDKDRVEHTQMVYESGLRGRKIPFKTKIETHDRGFGLKIEWGNINKE